MAGRQASNPAQTSIRPSLGPRVQCVIKSWPEPRAQNPSLPAFWPTVNSVRLMCNNCQLPQLPTVSQIKYRQHPAANLMPSNAESIFRPTPFVANGARDRGHRGAGGAG